MEVCRRLKPSKPKTLEFSQFFFVTKNYATLVIINFSMAKNICKFAFKIHYFNFLHSIHVYSVPSSPQNFGSFEMQIFKNENTYSNKRTSDIEFSSQIFFTMTHKWNSDAFLSSSSCPHTRTRHQWEQLLTLHAHYTMNVTQVAFHIALLAKNLMADMALCSTLMFGHVIVPRVPVFETLSAQFTHISTCNSSAQWLLDVSMQHIQLRLEGHELIQNFYLRIHAWESRKTHYEYKYNVMNTLNCQVWSSHSSVHKDLATLHTL